MGTKTEKTIIDSTIECLRGQISILKKAIKELECGGTTYKSKTPTATKSKRLRINGFEGVKGFLISIILRYPFHSDCKTINYP